MLASDSASLTAVIADDEPSSLALIRHRITTSATPLTIVGEARTGTEALTLIDRLKPDIAFLDIQMPPPTGIEIAASLAGRSLTKCVFVTAYDCHAVDAFEVCAVDYILKPIEQERINDTLKKLQTQFNQHRQLAAVKSFLEVFPLRDEPSNSTPSCDTQAACPEIFLTVQDGQKIIRIPIDCISFVQVSGDYVSIFYGNQRAFVRETLRSILARLPERQFVQAHRSTAVNIYQVRRASKSDGKQSLEMRDGRNVEISRSRFSVVRSLLK
ncbi:LytTR family DNA-binding domain-containing protein [Porticoccaceae bacterium]|nr:LytTR family DNA-binding domain-containing protein [Porticoccaceae bacterium]